MKRNTCRMVFGVAVMTAAAVMGETYVWQGPDGGSWKTPANWAPNLSAEGAITAADTLEFSNASEISIINDIENLTVDAVKISGTGNLTLTGNKLTVAGTDGILKTGTGNATYALALDFTAAKETSLQALVAGGTNDFTGAIGGSAPLMVHGFGATHLKGANTFTGTFTHTNGHLHVYHNLAFGATSAGSTFIKNETANSTSRKKEMSVFLHGVTLDEPLTFKSGSYDMLISWVKTTNTLNNVTINGNLRTTQQLPSSALIFGDRLSIIKSGNWLIPDAIGDRTDAPVILDAEGAFVGCLSMGGCYAIFRKPVRTQVTGRGGLTLYAPSSHIDFEVDDAVTDSTTADSALMGNAAMVDMGSYSYHTFNFNATVQHFKAVVGSGKGIVYKGTAGSRLVTYNTTTDTGYFKTNPEWGMRGSFQGAIELMVDGQYKDVAGMGTTRPVVLVDASTSTGALIVTNGATVCISNSASWAGPVRLTDASRLEVRNTKAFGANTAIELDGTSKIVFPDGVSGTFAANKLRVSGTQLAIGEWGAIGSGAANETAAIEGAGIISVADDVTDYGSDGVWTGGAGADTAFATGGNWQAGEAVETTGDSTVTIKGGTEMTLASEVALKHLAFDAAVSSFRFAGEGALKLMRDRKGVWASGSVMTIPGTRTDPAALECTFDVPVQFEETTFNQSIPGSNQVVRFNKPVSAASTLNWYKSGAGTLHLATNSTFKGLFSCEDGEVHAYGGSSFGDAANTVSLAQSTAGTRVYFHGGTYPQSFTWNANNRGANGEDALIYFKGDTTNVFTSAIYNKSGVRFYATEPRTLVVVKGGITGKQSLMPVGMGVSSEFRVEEKRIQVADVQVEGSSMMNPASFVFNVASNRFGTKYFMIHANTRVHMGAKHVFCRAEVNTPLVCDGGSSTSVMYLNGYDQECQLGDWNSSGTRTYKSSTFRIESDTPAVLDVKQEMDDITWQSRFMGMAGLVKSGAKDVTLANAAGYESSTSGRVEVVEGNLTLSATANLPNLGLLGVRGGVMLVESGAVLNEKVDVELESAGKLNLAAGTVRKVRHLMLNGVNQPRGTYGGTGSGAKHELADYFTGTGVLKVYGDGPGIRVYFR